MFKTANKIIQTVVNSGGICIKWNTLSHWGQSKESVARCAPRMCWATYFFVLNPCEKKVKNNKKN